MKKESTNTLPSKNKKLIELILSCNDCIYLPEELARMNEKRLNEVRDSLLFGLRKKMVRSNNDLFVQESSILGMVNDLFLVRQ